MNRKGDIPVTILVLGVIAVCALAIFSFYSSSVLVKDSFVGVGIVERLNAFAEEVRFNQARGEFIEESDIFKKGVSSSGVFFKGDKDDKGYYIEVTHSKSGKWGFGGTKKVFYAKYYL